MPKKRRVLITAGGTGGHLIPAQVLAEQLAERRSEVEVHFAASDLKTCRYFDRREYAYTEIPSSTLSPRRPIWALKGAVTLVRGIIKARTFIKEWRPDIVVGFGSYHALPVLVASRHVPLILHESNAYPGRVVRLFSGRAKLTGVAIPEATSHLKGRVAYVPTPLRRAYHQTLVSPSLAREHFGLQPDQPTLLVFGGSQGAQVLNQIVALALAQNDRWQVIHLTGHNEDMEAIASRYRLRLQSFYVAPFEPNMTTAWAAADLAVMRSGASSVAELLAMRCPAIMVPYPYATDAHQDANARWIQSLGGGIYLPQKELSVDRLQHCLNVCTQERLAAMHQALVTFHIEGSRSLLDCVLEVLG